jgi:hypothetical protein
VKALDKAWMFELVNDFDEWNIFEAVIESDGANRIEMVNDFDERNEIEAVNVAVGG